MQNDNTDFYIGVDATAFDVIEPLTDWGLSIYFDVDHDGFLSDSDKSVYFISNATDDYVIYRDYSTSEHSWLVSESGAPDTTLPSSGVYFATDFSTSRFDPALELSPHLNNLFSDVKNVGHKRAGSANLFVRGSRSESQLRSIPAGVLIFDEVDVMVQRNIILALERASGQVHKLFMFLSTPTIDNFGINDCFSLVLAECVRIFFIIARFNNNEIISTMTRNLGGFELTPMFNNPVFIRVHITTVFNSYL